MESGRRRPLNRRLAATIQQAVERRIERLPEELREVLSIASVIGKAFDSRDLEVLAGAKDVEGAIDRLVEEGLLEEERESVVIGGIREWCRA